MTTEVSSSSRLIRNVLTSWGAFLFSAVINFVLSPFVVRTLGSSAYGAWVLLNSTVGYLGLLDLGVRGAVTRYIAKFHSTGEHADASRLTVAALRVFGITALIALVLSIALSVWVDKAFNLQPEFISAARIIAVVGGITIAVALIGGVFGGVIIGLQRFDYSNAVDVINGVVRAIAIFATLKLGGGIVILALVQLGLSVIRSVLDFVMCRRMYPELRLNLGATDRKYLKMVLGFGLTSSALHVAGQIMLYSDSVVIGAFLPVSMVTFFAIAANLTDYARGVIGGISRALTPLVSATEARRGKAAIGEALLSSARLTTLVILPIVVTFVVRGGSFIGLWMGPEYAELSGRVLAILAVMVGCHAGYQVLTATMMGINKHRGLIPLFAGDAVTNVVLSIILVPRLGVVGSAIGTLVPQVVITLIAAPLYARRVLGVSVTDYWRDVHVRPLAAVIPFALLSILIEQYWPATSLLLYFAQVALVLPVVPLCGWFICMEPAERRLVANLLGRRRYAPTA